MRKSQITAKYFWDYDLRQADLSKPENRVWYLSRKLQFGDFSEISRADLKNYLSKLKIDASMKQLIKNYLQENE